MENDQFEDVLIYFSKSLLGKENEEDILRDVAENCISKLGFVHCSIYVIDEQKERLVQKVAYGPPNPEDKPLYNPAEIAMGKGITGHVAQTGKAEIVNDTSKDTRYVEDGDPKLSKICVPITHEDVTFGVIDCWHSEKGFFTVRHLKMLSAIASICGMKIKTVRTCGEVLKKQKKILKIREELLDLRLKAVNTQLNPHFVFNSLNAIQYFVTSEKKKLALDYLSTFSRLMRFYLKQLGKDTVALYNEIDMLHWYLKLQKLRYDDSFEYNIVIQKDGDNRKEAVIPSLLIHTLFENIIEHSMFSQQKNQYFNISFRITESIVTLSVEYQIAAPGNSDQPNFRKSILKWQDEVKLLNMVKNYDITNQVSDGMNGDIHRRNITLNLPNLV